VREVHKRCSGFAGLGRAECSDARTVVGSRSSSRGERGRNSQYVSRTSTWRNRGTRPVVAGHPVDVSKYVLDERQITR